MTVGLLKSAPRLRRRSDPKANDLAAVKQRRVYEPVRIERESFRVAGQFRDCHWYDGILSRESVTLGDYRKQK